MLVSLLPLSFLLGLSVAVPFDSRSVLFPRAEQWETLPATPDLPAPISTTTFAKDGTELWFQKYNFGTATASQTPIVLIHGGLGYSAYFGSVSHSIISKIPFFEYISTDT